MLAVMAKEIGQDSVLQDLVLQDLAFRGDSFLDGPRPALDKATADQVARAVPDP
jgi:hypothetical protein